MSERRHLISWILCAVLLGGAACGPAEDEFAANCDLQQSGRDVGGHWTLEGDGERTGCSNARLNGDLVIAMDPFDVASSAQETTGDATGTAATDPDTLSEADAFVERILRADHLLEFLNRPDEIDFTGVTAGSCVDFTLVEDLGSGDSQTIDFAGSVRDDGMLKGYFTGSGPGTCEMSGKITVDVR